MKSLIVTIVISALLFPTGTMFASDSSTGIHWHVLPVTYNIKTDSIPSGWIGPISQAAQAWTDRTKFKLARGVDTPYEDDSLLATHTIGRGTIPATNWGGCPPATTLACTSTLYTTTDKHILDDTLIFNSDFNSYFTTSGIECFLNTGYDIQTLALHELGHWGALVHSDNTSDAMYYSYNDCQRTPAAGDINSMNNNYTNAGH